MKITLSLILLTFSILLSVKSFGLTSDNFNIQTNSSFLFFNLSQYQSEDQIFIYFFENTISEENSVKIIDFISKRKGVISCEIDRLTKKMTITVSSEMQKVDIDGVVHYVEHNFFK
jgi:hypothetical protein